MPCVGTLNSGCVSLRHLVRNLLTLTWGVTLTYLCRIIVNNFHLYLRVGLFFLLAESEDRIWLRRRVE